MASVDFGKQIGPLPLGAWIAVVGGGLAIAVYNRRTATSEEPVIVEDTGSPEGVGEGAATPGWLPVNPPTDGDTGKVTYESNEAWGQAAINYLIAQGYAPGLANSAITKALNGGVDISGKKMSIQEWSLWSLALTKFGSPPYPVNVAPPSSVPGPVTPVPLPWPTKPPPPKPGKPPVGTTPKPGIPDHWTVVAKRGDSISKIAARYNKDWRTVWNFNLKYRAPATAAIMRARGPNLIFAGTTIWVPK
jgi:hypothetical protein